MASGRIFSRVNREPVLDSMRTALAAVVAMLLARLLHLPEFYWAPISAIVIVQSTIPPMTLGWHRFVGTALGAVVGIVLATFLHSSTFVYGLGILACGMLAWVLRLDTAYRCVHVTLSITTPVPRDHR